MLSDAVNAWSRGELAKHTVITAARALQPYGVKLMPLKGVELIARYGRDPAERWVADADVLIEPRKFGIACSALTRSGFRETMNGWSAVAFACPSGAIDLDVHRTALPMFMGKMSARWLFSRGHTSSNIFGVPVVHMHPADAIVHLLCTHLKDRLPRARVDTVAADLRSVARHTTPADVALAGSSAELRSAAWVALTDLLCGRDEYLLQPFLDELRPSIVARQRALAIRRVVGSLGAAHPHLSHAIVRNAGDSWSRGILSSALSLARTEGALRRIRKVAREMTG